MCNNNIAGEGTDTIAQYRNENQAVAASGSTTERGRKTDVIVTSL